MIALPIASELFFEQTGQVPVYEEPPPTLPKVEDFRKVPFRPLTPPADFTKASRKCVCHYEWGKPEGCDDDESCLKFFPDGGAVCATVESFSEVIQQEITHYKCVTRPDE